MSFTEAILIVLVVVLIYSIARRKSGGNAPGPSPLPPTNAQPAPAPAPPAEGFKLKLPKLPAKKEGFKSYDELTSGCLVENTEYFMAGGSLSDDAKKSLDCACDGSDGTFAKFDYGAQGLDYKEYVTSQGVDNKVIENHLQFVRDRKGLGPTGEFIQGRTYSPDSHDSYDPIPWIGLQRPQYVPVANPTQVPDVDYNLYKGRKPYCFWS